MPALPSQRRLNIAIELPDGGMSAYLARLVLGIAEFAQRHGRWRVLGPSSGHARFLTPLDADGVIAFRDKTPASRRRIPVVHVGTRESPTYPPGSVLSDNRGIGASAAEHLLERGLRHFAFVINISGNVLTNERCAGFRARIEQDGAAYVGTLAVRGADSNGRHDQSTLIRSIRRMPKPVGVMCVTDPVAREFADMCHRAGAAVPDEVAIVGVDDEKIMCMLAEPPISSVDPAGNRVGYAAAAMINSILSGARPPRQPVLIPPTGVVVRQSSDTLAVDDSDVANALRFIRDHCTTQMTVADVLRHVPASRRSLDQRFRRRLGRSMHDELQHARARRASELLIRSELSIPQIASQCGFRSREYFSAAFGRLIGMPPGAYRRKHQAPPDYINQ